MTPTLLVLAAGMGSRYGGLKQIDAVGAHGEAIIDFSIYDAIRAGFGKVVFVIRRDIEADFKKAIGSKFSSRLPVEYAYQELDMLPPGFTLPPARKKPWGTSHAIMAASGVIREPFAVINADDFYGAASFKTLADYLKQSRDTATVADYSMVGFILRNTLSEHGTVSRAICERDAASFLTNIVERTKIEKAGNAARFLDEAGQAHPLTGDELVSMNMFGFTPSAFELLQAEFVKFLTTRINDEKAEFFIPTPMNALIKAGRARMKVLASTSAWFGITYREDKPTVVASIARLVQQGVYPEKLWT
jgi:UTP-glucose-1-phosphate uridylyltransferase